MDLADIRDAVIGRDAVIDGPFGPRRVTYADYTASGRSLEFIEDFIRNVVLPLYANTHTETSGTGLQTTRLREEARNIIRDAIGGRTGEHAVIFCGSGSTGAIDKLVTILGLRLPAQLEDTYHLSDMIPPDRRPVVFVGPFEHHSNELPWRESVADVVEIDEDEDGHVDLTHLESMLVEFQDRPLRIGSFSAASNVTGITSDTSAISSLLHRYGALSFWDFAAAAPYVGIEMRSPDTHGLDYKDAVFISPHKFIGGPGTPGVLVVRTDLLHNRVPSVPGGGTVEYVSGFEHRYLKQPEHREEGGTPEIVGSIRSGLVFKLKETVGAERIRALETRHVRRAIDTWAEHPNVRILGNLRAERLSIVSFAIRDPARPDWYLHHNLVVALLNDLFGIQARGGCSCAGPYGHRLLGIDDDTSLRYEEAVARGWEVIKPGWARVNFNYFIDDDEAAFIIDAVSFIADHGPAFLPVYGVDPATAVWRHQDAPATPAVSLHDVDFVTEVDRSLPEARHRSTYLSEAVTLARTPWPSPDALELPDDIEDLRWFRLPHEG